MNVALEKEISDDVSSRVIGAAIEVHREMGPGLLESVYEQCLVRELTMRDIPFEQQKRLPIFYKGQELDGGYRADLVIENELIVELKATSDLLDCHVAQLLTYLRLTKVKRGLLINFNEPLLKDGVRRVSNYFRYN